MPDSLEQIAAEVRACQRCSLAKGRIRAVPGEGPADARIMLIGEGPGYHEDRQSSFELPRPRSGQSSITEAFFV